MKTMPANVRGAVRWSPRWTAPTSEPMATAKTAGSTPRSRRPAHQTTANVRSAFGRSAENFHSSRWNRRLTGWTPEGHNSLVTAGNGRPEGRPLHLNRAAGLNLKIERPVTRKERPVTRKEAPGTRKGAAGHPKRSGRSPEKERPVFRPAGRSPMKPHKHLVGLSALAVVAFTLGGHAAGRFSQKLPADKRAVHALNRLTFGPRPGDAAKVRRQGVEKWIDQQLHPESIPENPILETRLASLRTVNLLTWQILERYPAVPAALAARPPSVAAFSSLPQPQINRLVNGSIEDRQTVLNSMDPATRRLVLAGAPPQVLEGLPESLTQEAARVKQTEQEERQKEFRRLNPPLNELLAGEQLRVATRGTPQEKLALLNSFDPAIR